MQERTALWTGALHGRTEVVRLLLQHGARIDHAGDNEVSCLASLLLTGVATKDCTGLIMYHLRCDLPTSGGKICVAT